MTHIHLAALPALPQLTGWMLAGAITIGILGSLAMLGFTCAIQAQRKGTEHSRREEEERFNELKDRRDALLEQSENRMGLLLDANSKIEELKGNMDSVKLAIWGEPLLADRTLKEIIEFIEESKDHLHRATKVIHDLQRSNRSLVDTVQRLKEENTSLYQAFKLAEAKARRPVLQSEREPTADQAVS